MTAKKNTITKYKVIGTQEYIDRNTGELIEMKIQKTEQRDFNFYKVWVNQLTESLDSIMNQKTRVAFWIINNLNRENQLVYTQTQIANKVNVSVQTVNWTIQEMMKNDLLRKSNGAYIVNPNIIFKGSTSTREKIMDDYLAAEKYNSKTKYKTDKARLTAVRKQIDKLRHQEAALQASIHNSAS